MLIRRSRTLSVKLSVPTQTGGYNEKEKQKQKESP